MKMQSVRDLKLEVIANIIQPMVTQAIARSLEDAGAAAVAMGARLVSPMSVSSGSSTPRPHRSLGLGISRRGNEFKLAIRVQRQALMHSPLVEKLIAKAKGEVDVKLIGRVDKRVAGKSAPRAQAALDWNRDDNRPMQIGASVGHYQVTAGTIGAFVRDDNGIYILSNNHVLANENQAKQGDAILQRARADGGRIGTNTMGTLSRWIDLDLENANTCDAALALVNESDINPGLLRGILNGVDQQLQGSAWANSATVFKIGRTTGVTKGRISAFEVDNIVVGYEIGDLMFNDSIEIESDDSQPFSDGGDSGSLIVNEQMEGVALLFAGSDSGGSNGLGITYAHPFISVLNRLNVTLQT